MRLKNTFAASSSLQSFLLLVFPINIHPSDDQSNCLCRHLCSLMDIGVLYNICDLLAFVWVFLRSKWFNYDQIDGSNIKKRRCIEPNQSIQTTDDFLLENCLPNFPRESRVRFIEDNFYQGGVVVWTGYHVTHGTSVVVLFIPSENMVEIDFGPQVPLPPNFSLNDCPKGYRMLRVDDVERLPVLEKGDYCVLRDRIGSKSLNGGFVREITSDSCRLFPVEKNYKDSRNVDTKQSINYHLHKVTPPETETVSSYVRPIEGTERKFLIGRNKGIQGKGNSCYLDSLLFSFFVFMDDIEEVLSESENGINKENLSILTTLRLDIVYPLRSHQFVSHHHVQRLRQGIAAKTGNRNYLAEIRDIPECLDDLFGKLLNIPPMVSIGHYINGKPQFNGLYSVEILMMDNSANIPSSNQLLQRSAVQMQFCLEKMPDCLLLQVAREPGISVQLSPSPTIDLKSLIYTTTKVCTKCRSNATKQFWNAATQVNETYYCEDCAMKYEFVMEEGVDLYKAEMGSIVDEETVVTLVGILCIERSHYNCFVRSKLMNDWVFFDSMSGRESLLDAESNIRDDVNIPEVKDVPQLEEWLKDVSSNQHLNLDSYLDKLTGDDKILATRVFRCPSLLIYKLI